ncbi:disintegrin and metalloproteinase domain-containing protein 9-like [Gastrophryne carolinensis]
MRQALLGVLRARKLHNQLANIQKKPMDCLPAPVRHHVASLRNEEIVLPERVLDRARRDAGNNHMDHWEDSLLYLIPTLNRTLLLNLQQNRDFISKDFQKFTYSKDGGLQRLNGTVPNYSCYYYGHVDGVNDSVVSLSTCHGLRGILYLNEIHYGIEPLKHSLKGEHRLYQLEEPEEPSMCGVGDFSTSTSHKLLPSYYHIRRKRGILLTTNFVEVGIVVDNLRYQMDKANSTQVELETIQLVNIVDGMYRPLNIRIVLTNLIIWSTANPFEVDTSGLSAGDVLGRFSQWRDATSLQRCDIYHLLIGRGPYSGVIGMAFVGTVCSPRLATSISAFSGTPESHASVVAHELGHVLGMNHDDTTCPGAYVMHSADIGARNFSSCSADDFEALIVNGGGTCLLNPPDPNQVLSIPVCGNNIVEGGEECDCGSTKDCKNTCCDAATCRLTSGSQCAQGLCCENCKFKVAGTPCRATANSCDLPEYCNGSHALCPVDVYIMNGYSCNNSQSYCYGGICQSYNAQCLALLGSGSAKAPDECFKKFNQIGDKFGNCGQVNRKCTEANSLCGKLQCTPGSNMIHSDYATISQKVNGTDCISVDFNLGTDVPDPGLVHQGSPCAPGKACVNYQCVNASQLGFNCDIKGKCNDHGVCNNNGNCHCNDGWAPPYCDRGGYGGSIDSGPTHIDTSLRDGLLIFFLLVVPILVLLIVMWIKRDALKRKFCRRKRRNRGRGGNEQATRQIRNHNTTQNGPSNGPRNQNRTFSDVFTISHNVPQRNPMPGMRPPQPARPPPPRPSAVPQYNWPPNA